MGNRRQPSKPFIRRLKSYSEPATKPVSRVRRYKESDAWLWTEIAAVVVGLAFVIPTAIALWIDLADRKTQRIAQAWELATRLAPGNSGKGPALEYLNSQGILLIGINLSAEENLGSIYLRNIDLSGADLSRANLSGADLSHANLSGANFGGTNLSGARLNKANLSGADLSHANLSEAWLNSANLSNTSLTGTQFQEAKIWGSDLSGATFRGTVLSGARLDGVNLSNAELEGVNLSRAILGKANFDGVTFPKGAILSGASLGRAKNGSIRISQRVFSGTAPSIGLTILPGVLIANLPQPESDDGVREES